MLGLAILFAFNLLGYAIQMGLHVPLPGNVIGLILFTAALFAKWIKLAWVEEAASMLTRHMMLFFLPFTVGVIAFLPLLGSNWLSVCGGLFGATFAVLAVTGWVAKRLGIGSREEGAAHGK
ncbi:CidA/LrgA family protein [Paenibacillus aestuarii]|uniref:CidA/LrgA family protein n=1 Tax=Paenibacillus aestuarii TaxID=516965 RepID=A0ABW0KK31_9BACL|nr:CidA/LrgA family protein [Paenibacillus aestuarii]